MVKQVMYFYIFILSILLTPAVSSAQIKPLKFTNYTVKDGLVHDIVVKTIEDKKGFIWIATLNGLSKFDGKNFTNYTAIEGNKKSLRSNWITDLLLDNNGTVWVSTEWGICWYNEDEDNFEYINEMNSLYILYKAPICLDDEGNIFCATEKGLIIINTKTKQYKKTALNRIVDPQCIAYFNQKIFIGTRGHHLLVYENKYDTYSSYENSLIPLGTHIMNFFVDNNELWLSTSIGLLKLDNNNKLFLYNQSTFNKQEKIGSLMCTIKLEAITGDSLLLCGTYHKKLLLFNKHQQKFVQEWVNEKNNFEGLQYSIFNNFSILKKTLWMCTNSGLTKLNSANPFYHTYFIPTINDKKNAPLLVHQILQHPLNAKQLFLIIGVKNNFLAIYNKQENVLVKKFPSNQQINTYRSFAIVDNALWAIKENAVDKFDLNLNFLTTIQSNFTPTENKVYVHEKNIYIPNFSGFTIFNTITKKFKEHPLNFNGTEIENNSFNAPFIVNGITHTDSTNIWLASIKYGLFNYNTNTQKLLPFRQPSNLLYETKNRCSDILKDDKNNLWVSTMSGLTLFEFQKKAFTNFSNKDGLYSSYVYSLALANDNKIWGRGNGGIFCFDIATKKFENFLLNSTINSNYYQQKISCINNEIYLGFEGGFVQFSNNNNHFDSSINQIVLTKILSLNTQQTFSHNKKNIEFSNNDNNIALQFAALSFNNSEQVNYACKLENFDKDWILLNTNNNVHYANLKPGNYLFFAKARLGNGEWGKQVQLIEITVKAALWQRLWFQILCSLLFAGSLFYFIRWWQNNKIKVETEKTKNEQLKAEQLKAELELEQISNFFTTSLINKNNIDEVLWDVAKNLIGKLGFVDCMIYLWNADKTKLIQKAGYGPKGSIEEINKLPFDVVLGQGVVGYVAQHKEAVIIADTSMDERYRQDEMIRLSEICLPILYNDELIGVIDSEHHEKNFYTERHLKILTTIATLIANKIKSIEAENLAREKELALQTVSKENTELQLAALRSQMNPHFIFNSLNSIQKYIWENKQEDASEYLTKFAKLMRLILEHSAKKLISLEEEIIALQLYLELEHRRCSNKFDYSFSVDEKLNTANILLPPMLIQPHIENAIWHGLLPKEERGFLKVNISLQQHNSLQCIIEDNGIGRKKSAELNAQKTHKTSSFGTHITEKRLGFANLLGLTGEMKIKDLYNEQGKATGTIVKLNIPIETFEKIK